MSEKTKTILTILITALITAVLVGGSVFVWNLNVCHDKVDKSLELIKGR